MPYPSISDLVTFDASVQSILDQTGGASYNVGISGDENTIAVYGANDLVILTKSGGTWVQKGNTVSRLTNSADSSTISLSYDGNTCISTVFASFSSKLSILRYNGTNWSTLTITNIPSFNFPFDLRQNTLSDDGSIFSISDKEIYGVYRYDPDTQSVSTVSVENVSAAGQIGQISNDASILVTLCRTDNKIRLFTYDGTQYNFSSEITAEAFPNDSNVSISRELNKVVCTGGNFLYTAEIVNGTTLTNISSKISVGEVVSSRGLSPDGTRLYVGCKYASMIKIYNTEGQNPVLLAATGTPAELSGASYPYYGSALGVGGYGSLIVGSGNAYPYLFMVPPPDLEPPTLTLPSNPIVVYKNQPVPDDRFASVTDNNPAITASDVVISSDGIVNGAFPTPGVFQATWTVSDGENTVTANGTILVLNQAYSAPICFVAGTKVTTDQGEIAIDKIIPGTHTINGEAVVDVTETIDTEDTLVEIEKDALAIGIPSVRTVMTNKHKVSYNGEMVEAGSLVGKAGINHITYTGEFVYNVVLPTYSTMFVNGMTCETLHPENVQYRLMTLHKQMLIGKCTDEIGKEFSQLMEAHKRMCSV